MAQTLADVLASITVVDGKIDALATQLTDLSNDFDAAVAKLEADIAAGVDTTPAVTALGALADKLGTVSAAIAAIDLKAETVSGTPTP